ncbi:UbiA prenyltransferase family-domain-containing protein [Mycena metata]|uniref:UbiA prenyltransferase family-domain-containing protein n=1 Tax=Mycena metata TaxID=1033252 RepID=A0AAD7JIP7_9AGAR|nr:UbiA prenyltransferase family-domain-containing protein [Mycena metata]
MSYLKFTPSPRPLFTRLFEFLKIIFLFSQSDIVPILGPSLAVSMVLAGPTNTTTFTRDFIWLELHLLIFEIKNQIVGLEEDRLSKPNRPIVSGRISPSAAQILYLFVGTLAVLHSVYYDLVLCSAIYMVAIYCYNEGDMARNWFLKSFLGSLGYACYCWGTIVIFGECPATSHSTSTDLPPDHGKSLSQTSIIAIAVSGLVHTTTGHAQDFRDRFGDASIGRKTLPILLPQGLARWSLMVLVAAWTAGLTYLWSPPILVALIFSTLCCVSTAKFVLNHSVEADRNSYFWYNLWLITAHLLPIFKRIQSSA